MDNIQEEFARRMGINTQNSVANDINNKGKKCTQNAGYFSGLVNHIFTQHDYMSLCLLRRILYMSPLKHTRTIRILSDIELDVFMCVLGLVDSGFKATTSAIVGCLGFRTYVVSQSLTKLKNGYFVDNENRGWVVTEGGRKLYADMEDSLDEVLESNKTFVHIYCAEKKKRYLERRKANGGKLLGGKHAKRKGQ